MPSQNAIAPTNGSAISITDDLDESKIPSTKSLKASVSPRKINLHSAITNAMMKNAIQI
jgi:hypothetical protein